MLNTGRILGNFLFIFGYIIILFANVKIGILLRLVGNVMSFPYFFKIRMWDMLILRLFFGSIEIVKLISLIPQ